jgi:hypothetical protein
MPANKFPIMRTIPAFLALLAVLVLSACSTPESRISANQAAFDTLPPEAQQKIRNGQVDVGFTPEMVLMALGEPTKKYVRQTEHDAVEVWSYIKTSPQFSIGVGAGSYGGGSSSGVGVGTTTGGEVDEKVRVEFRGGRVSVAEYRK